MVKICSILIFLAISSWYPAVGKDSNTGKIKAFVSIPPQAYFVDAIGGRNVDVEVLLEGGQSPETYEPTSKQMVSLAGADAYFRIGFPFEERLVEKISASIPDLKVIDTRRGIRLREMEGTLDDHQEDVNGKDPHIWLDPVMVKQQAGTICELLKKIDAANAAYYDSNLIDFSERLDDFDSRLSDLLASSKGKAILVFHPTFGYFADRYGLKQISIEVDGKEPGAKYLAELIESAKKERIRIVFMQPQFQSGNAEAVARAIDGQVVVVDPLSYDYINNLLDFAKIVAADSDE